MRLWRSGGTSSDPSGMLEQPRTNRCRRRSLPVFGQRLHRPGPNYEQGRETLVHPLRHRPRHPRPRRNPGHLAHRPRLPQQTDQHLHRPHRHGRPRIRPHLRRIHKPRPTRRHQRPGHVSTRTPTPRTAPSPGPTRAVSTPAATAPSPAPAPPRSPAAKPPTTKAPAAAASTEHRPRRRRSRSPRSAAGPAKPRRSPRPPPAPGTAPPTTPAAARSSQSGTGGTKLGTSTKRKESREQPHGQPLTSYAAQALSLKPESPSARVSERPTKPPKPATGPALAETH